MSDRAPEQRWVTVRVEDSGDCLIIHPDDAREHGLDWDQVYKGYVTGDGNLRVPLHQPTSKASGGDHGHD